MVTYKITFSEEPEFLHAVVTGENSREAVLAYLDEIRHECLARRRARVLIEERLDGPRLGLADVYDIASRSRQGVEPGPLPVIGYVDVNAVTPSMEFAENVAVNRGVNVQVFATVAEAAQWLRDRAAADDAQTRGEDAGAAQA